MSLLTASIISKINSCLQVVCVLALVRARACVRADAAQLTSTERGGGGLQIIANLNIRCLRENEKGNLNIHGLRFNLNYDSPIKQRSGMFRPGWQRHGGEGFIPLASGAAAAGDADFAAKLR